MAEFLVTSAITVKLRQQRRVFRGDFAGFACHTEEATQQIIPGLNVGVDSYYKKAADLIEEGQFGPALIFETFNYAKGRAWSRADFLLLM
jgi:hypothetical protein